MGEDGPAEPVFAPNPEAEPELEPTSPEEGTEPGPVKPEEGKLPPASTEPDEEAGRVLYPAAEMSESVVTWLGERHLSAPSSFGQPCGICKSAIHTFFFGRSLGAALLKLNLRSISARVGGAAGVTGADPRPGDASGDGLAVDIIDARVSFWCRCCGQAYRAISTRMTMLVANRQVLL